MSRTHVTIAFVTPCTLDCNFSHFADSQDVNCIMDDFNVDCNDYDFRSFFVSYADGDYGTVYGCFSQFPTNYANLYELAIY